MRVQILFAALGAASTLTSTSSAFSFAPPRNPVFLGRRTTPLGMAASTGSSTLQRLPDSAVQVDIVAPASATKAAYDKVCSELSKNIHIAGFRKGSKIPPMVLEQAMAAKGGRNALKVEAIKELLGQLVEPAIKDEHGLEPLGQPTLVVPAEELADQYRPGEDLTIQVKCDVWPDIKWKDTDDGSKPYVGLKGKYSRKPFDQAKYDKAFKDLMERYAVLEPIDDDSYVLEMGDSCVVNMDGFMVKEDGSKGDPLPNAASGDNVEVILETGRYMTGLVEGLVGAKKGDTRTVTVTFPQGLRDKTLAGKDALFDVVVLEASKRTIPELTDELANKIRSGLTAESLEKELLKAVDAEDSKEFIPARNAALAQALSAVLEVEVPDTLVNKQAQEKFALMMTDMRNSGVSDAEIKKQISPENFLKYKNIVKDDIIRDFKVSMATDEIGRLEKIDVPDYQVEEQLEAVKKEAIQAKQEEEFDEKVMRDRIEATLQRQAVMDFLADNGDLTVEYTDASPEFDEGLLEKLAEDSLKREQGSSATTAVTPADASDATVEVEPSKPAKNDSSEDVDLASMSLEDKAYYALKNSGALDDIDDV